MTLVKFNGNNALMPGFNDVFESIFSDTFFADRFLNRVPAVNISDSTEGYHIELAAPGLKKKDFKISVDRNMLSISVEKQEEKSDENKNYNKREFSYSSFARSFNLPDLADYNRIEASYEDGILKVYIAKKEEAKRINRLIEIK